jgi:O-6-methylguanine DNA methyltransferase
MNQFASQVKNVVRSIPAGKTMSYGEVAKKAGSPKAARAVANLMAKNFDPEIPCHRVVLKDGSPAGYNRGGEAVKKQLLLAEGVVI